MRLPLILFAAAPLAGCSPLMSVIQTASLLTPTLARPECGTCTDEIAASDRLADSVPASMEQSRLEAGPGATAIRTGFFTWELSAPGREPAKCSAARVRGWRCETPPAWNAPL